MPNVISELDVTSSIIKVGSSVIPACSVISGSVEFIIGVVMIVVVVGFEVVVVVVVVVVVADVVADVVLIDSPTSLAHLTAKFSKVVDIGKHFPFDSLSIPTSISR